MTTALDRRQTLIGLAALSLSSCRAPEVRPEVRYDAEIIVIGAGLAGLYAAKLLAEDDRDVLVLEGSDRIGGRLHTLSLPDGRYTECGGEQIGASYARFLSLAEELNVELVPEILPSASTCYVIGQTPMSVDDFKSKFAHLLPGPYAGTTPTSAFFRAAARNNPLKSGLDWLAPEFENFDVSAEVFLRDTGIDGRGLQFIDHTLNGNSVTTYSMLNLYRSLYLYGQSRRMGPSFHVRKGARNFTQNLAAVLPQRIRMKQIIQTITVDGTGVTLTTRTGKRWRAAQAICTLPYAVLRHMDVKVPLADAQREAVAALPYTQILQVHFQADIPYWEKDGLPANMWTDSIMERVFINRAEDGQPDGLGRVWINGTNATMLDRLPDEKLFEWASNELKRQRPSSEGKITPLKVQRWTTSNPFSGGAYMHWAPGQVAQWANKMGTPAGRLYFAGEHLGQLNTGMEAALESGESAAFQIMGI